MTPFPRGSNVSGNFYNSYTKLTVIFLLIQLLINQVAGLKSKMDTKDEGEVSNDNATVVQAADSPPASATPNNEVNGGGGRTKYDDIASKAVGMTESIKHAIVLLQIAKVRLFHQPPGWFSTTKYLASSSP